MLHVWGRREMPTGFWWGNLQKRDTLEDLGMDERMTSQRVLNRLKGKDGTLWLLTGPLSVRLL